ncbi:pol polyprotein [Tanacetum coccineum]|uniref:Pol polyprotein n=1 Tax=Tanacetum coccineum TaxID=301880 RepID=A0ABQ5E2H0_9ASTR
MFFYLTTLNLARFLNEIAPQVEPLAKGQPFNAQVVQAVEAWKHLDFLCHNYVLNGLVDSLYNVYCKTTTAKELWDSLERKYKTKDAGTKKFVVAHFLDHKIVDLKNVITQVQDLQVLLHDIHAEGMTMCEAFQVAFIIEKPTSWSQKNTYTHDSAKANMVEHAGSSSKSNSKEKGKGKKKNDKKNKGKAEYLAPKARIFPKWVNPRQANMVNDNVDMIAVVSDVIAMISEVNLVVRSDRGGEYVSPFAELYAKQGIRHEFTTPYSPQQNNIAKRKNRTLKEMVNAMLIISSLSQDMWGEAILTATYFYNKIPRKEKEKTPYELWMGRKPSYKYLRVWGCLAKVAVSTPKAQKIGQWIIYSLDMLRIAVLIVSLLMLKKSRYTNGMPEVMESRNASS